jgi:hypothetical protein
MQYPKDKNGLVLKNMLDKGINLERTYEIDFFHFFKEEESAVRMAQETQEKYSDIKVVVSSNKVARGFDVYVSKTMQPTHQLINEFESNFGEIATRCGGKSDGWGFESEYKKPVPPN